jgi:hypothetical protein
MSLAEVDEFAVPANLVDVTEDQLREAGRQVAERFVLWTGRRHGHRFAVETLHVPAQTAYRLESGLCVRVDGPALQELNDWLFANDQRLAVQVHAHPGRAYHSDLDSAFPIITVLGGLSIVVPDFCRRSLLGRGTAAYRLTRRGWKPSQTSLDRLVTVI